MNELLHVFIIEDDFRVADINREITSQVAGLAVSGMAKTGDEAMAFLRSASRLPDLILLDMYIPDRRGLELFWEIRTQFPRVAIIMLTAATDRETISETVRGGIFDYLIKPIEFSRFTLALERFRDQRLALGDKDEWEQADIDRLFGISPPAPTDLETDASETLPKGIDQLTLDGVRKFLGASVKDGINAMEAGKAVGVSRSTARRYLEHLVASGEAKAQLNYGEIGRPERRYIPWTK